MQRAAPMDSTTAARKVYKTVGWMAVCWTAQSVGMLAAQSENVKVGRLVGCEKGRLVGWEDGFLLGCFEGL